MRDRNLNLSVLTLRAPTVFTNALKDRLFLVAGARRYLRIIDTHSIGQLHHTPHSFAVLSLTITVCLPPYSLVLSL